MPAQLVRRGYREDDFFSIGEDGIPRLKNVEDHFYFFDQERKRCKEYVSRPLECCIYPGNLTEDKKVVIDELCPEVSTLSSEEVAEKRRRLRKLLNTIDAEAASKLSSRRYPSDCEHRVQISKVDK